MSLDKWGVHLLPKGTYTAEGNAVMSTFSGDSLAQGSALTPVQLLRKSLVIYGVMAVIGVAVMLFAHKNLESAFAWPSDWMVAGQLISIGLLGAVVLLVTSYFFEEWLPSFRDLKAAVMRLLGPSSVATALSLSVVTAIGEELLFRGALQPFAGLFVTSFLFGLLHMGKDGLLSAWSVWAFLAGLLLGWMFNATGSLWPCMIAHFAVNAVSILKLRRAYNAWLNLTVGKTIFGETEVQSEVGSDVGSDSNTPDDRNSDS